MSSQPGGGLGAVVLAAGRSKRFGGEGSKLLAPLCGRPLLEHVLSTLRSVHRSAKLRSVVLVVSPGQTIRKAVDTSLYPFPITFAVQRKPRGTGDAVRAALPSLDGVREVLVMAGDAPLVSADSLLALVRRRRQARADGVLLTAVLDDGGPYGRILRADGRITRVVETRDATPDERAIREINTCTYVFTKDAIARALPRLRTNNDQGELLFTDVVGELAGDGATLTSVEGDPDEVLGTNTRAELAGVARILRERILDELMANGVTVVDPATTYVDAGVRCGADTVLLPFTFLEGATRVGQGCEIGPSARLVDTTVGDGATVTFAVARSATIGPQARVGPFASLRPGTTLGRGAEMGSFGEMKNAKIGDGVKVHHFSYLGDVKIGKGTNVGAGTITCNYDGVRKHPTVIGDDVFIGSDSILVAPVRVGRGAYTGAGSVVTRDVRAGELVYGVPAVRRTRAAGKAAAKDGAAKGRATRKAKAKAKAKKTKRAPKRPVKKKGRR